MSDGKRYPSRDEVIDFFEKKKIDVSCEVCHSSTGWILHESDHVRNISLENLVGDHRSIYEGAPYIPAVICVCQNCANIRLFSLMHLKKLIEE